MRKTTDNGAGTPLGLQLVGQLQLPPAVFVQTEDPTVVFKVKLGESEKATPPPPGIKLLVSKIKFAESAKATPPPPAVKVVVSNVKFAESA